MNDLVKGLRGELLDCKCNAYCYGECGCDTTWPESLCGDAADEIEMQEALLREIDRELDDVEYLGSYVDGIKALKAEIERLQRICRDAYEVWAGSEGIPEPETAAEAYLLQLLEQMRDEIKKGVVRAAAEIKQLKSQLKEK